MTTQAQMSPEISLWEGSSREAIFDCLKYGGIHEKFARVKFSTEERILFGTRVGECEIMIEGLYRAGRTDEDWFFWGRLSEDPKIHVFGRWNTNMRRGKMILSNKSLFQSPLSKGLEADDPDTETAEDRAAALE